MRLMDGVLLAVRNTSSDGPVLLRTNAEAITSASQMTIDKELDAHSYDGVVATGRPTDYSQEHISRNPFSFTS